jgi:hypothetical protein
MPASATGQSVAETTMPTKSTDFVDADLNQWDEPAKKTKRRKKAAPKDTELFDAEPATVESATDATAGRLAQHKAQVDTGMVKALSEIERLRRRQSHLEQEKSDLEDLANKQIEYERGKREVTQHLHEGIVALERKEVQTAQLTELVITTRARFKDSLEEVDCINEDNWPDDRFREELYKALVIIDDARMEYNKALAKINVLDSDEDTLAESRNSAPIASHAGVTEERSFRYWMKVGFALSVPPMILLAVVLVVVLLLRLFNLA